jgi:phenylacetate-CoA ligase
MSGAEMRRAEPPSPEELDPVERVSRDELMALQVERLQRTLAHAYENVPLYRRKFDSHGVHPADCKSLDDLAHFPFTTKQDLRDC